MRYEDACEDVWEHADGGREGSREPSRERTNGPISYDHVVPESQSEAVSSR